MLRRRKIWMPLVCVGLAAGLAAGLVGEEKKVSSRADLEKTFNSGNFKDAYEGYRRLALDPADEPGEVSKDLRMAIVALNNLGRADEIDELRESVVKIHARNWRLLWTAAQTLFEDEDYGFIVAGKFYRGQRRGQQGGRPVNCAERDRVRALQLMVEALPAAHADNQKNETASFLLSLADMLLGNRGAAESWRLQYLSDLSTLPDYDQGWRWGSQVGGAPVDADGNPVFHTAPKSFAAAESDGQRWRWCLAEAAEVAPARNSEVRYRFAEFLHQQFGVQTMAQFGLFLPQADDDRQDTSGTYELHTLADDETIARLASGVKRFKLPEEFDFVKIFQQIAGDGRSGQGELSLQMLAQIFEDRRQYPRAAEYWRQVLREYGPGPNQFRSQRLQQIVGNWGRFEPIMTQPAGQGATVEYRYRNGRKVAFEAHQVNVARLLEDVKAYLKSHPRQLDWQKLNVADLGYRLVHENQAQYVGARVAAWDLELKPRPQHFDNRVTVATPLQKAGAYLVTATMADGNVSKIILWVADTAIVKKPLDKRVLYWIADAANGQPVARANLELFGYRQRHIKNNEYQVDTLNFAEASDADGLVYPNPKQLPQDYQWIAVARTAAGRLAYLGFSGVWYGNYYDAEYNQTKVLLITDRPVYRPRQTVKFKFWVRHAKYDQEDTSSFAGHDFNVEVLNPKGDKVLAKGFKADDYGGFEGQLDLPADATLGVYQAQIPNVGGGSFRVEEYKKPEFEVTVEAPSEPVMLGEKIAATVKARYYFGAPVAEAKVKYKVLRTSHRQPWYPIGAWDWFYGRGYWWFAYDYAWYPGWNEWGCARPIAWWWWGGRAQQPPEVVAEQEVPIGADGTIKIEIDTALAKALHGDTDHSYQVTAEVVDQSRRTIVGAGNVLAARKPFKVFAWVDRGYYRVGDTVQTYYKAQTLDQKPVKGAGRLALLKISYDRNAKPVERVVQEWNLPADEQGEARQQIKAAEPGQYRLSYKVTDAKEHQIEGGYVFTVVGRATGPAEFRFSDVELVTEKREYQPGEKLRLLVNANRADAAVLLFVRPANGLYLAPKVLRLSGKSAVEEIQIVQRDMPNCFIEAVTVAGGKVHSDLREVIVPPQRRVLGVVVAPSASTYKPGQKAQVKLKLTDAAGKPFVGSTVVAIYDKSLEYVSGGSNVPEIKEFFWKWRRTHHPQGESSLERGAYNLTLPNKPGMNDLGAFGAGVVEEFGQQDAGEAGAPRNAAGGRGFAGGFGRRLATRSAAPGAPMARTADSLREEPGAELPADAAKKESLVEAEQTADTPLVQPTVRSKFADTALWVGSLVTDASGAAEVALDMPENLTTWKVRCWGMGHGTKVGQGDAEVITRKDLIIRLQAPRFFVQSDEVVLSANVHNYLPHKKTVRVALETDGQLLAPADSRPPQRSVAVEAQGETRVDWRMRVLDEGQPKVKMLALTDEESDAMELTLPSYVHGILKTESYSGAIRPEQNSGKFTVVVPKERRIGQSRLEVRYSPTLAGAMVDALPYLADYPYGCTEQTLNRFLPTVITQKVLLDMKLDLKAIREKRTNLNAQEIGEDRERARQWQRFDRNPVFDVDEVRQMVKEGVQKLTEMQLSDGGWGWFSGWGEHSSPHTTAVVVHGLQVAQANDVAIVPGTVERGVGWLTAYQNEQVRRLQNEPAKKDPWKERADDVDALVFMVLTDAGVRNADMLAFLYRDRNHLAVYTKAMLGLACHALGDQEKVAMLVRNIGQFLVQDDENQTAYLRLPESNYWWYWYGSEYEAHAYYLKLLAKTDPQGPLAPRLVKYLLNNRKHATYWNSTRDTAICIEAFADYLRASGEDRPELTVQVLVDGRVRKEVQVSAENLFTFDNKLVLEGDGVEDGVHQVELRKTGRGPLYFNGYLTNFTLEDHIAKAGLEIKVQRKFYKLSKVDKRVKVAGSRGQAVDQKVEKYERAELANLATLKSGDLVEIELEIDSKNDYEYLMFEDLKAAGFEPVEVRSGYGGNELGAYMELRDNRVVFFCRSLARGKHSVSYRMRAEIPGKFSALPTLASAMYAPELKANSDEIKLRIED